MQSDQHLTKGTQRMCQRLSKRTPALLCIAAIILIATLTAPASFAQSSESDPSIKGIPFDIWLAGEDSKQIPLTVTVEPSGLTHYQRLGASFSAVFPVGGLRTAKGGRFIYMAQIIDSRGKSFRVSGPVDITNPLAQKTSVNIILNLKAFVLPGDYKFALSIYDPVTQTHGVAHKDLHVPPLKNDPLPNAWANLPPVNFFTAELLPDDLGGNLDLPLKVARPVRVQVIANTTPTRALSPSVEVYQNNLSFLIPELEVLSQIRVNSGSLDVIALDLENHKVAFEQDGVQTLDRERLRDALNPQQAAVVSASSLSQRSQEAQFFTIEISKRISCGDSPSNAIAGDPRRVIIVLSNDMAFTKDEDLSPVATKGSCNPQVFYIRTHFTLQPFGGEPRMGYTAEGPEIRLGGGGAVYCNTLQVGSRGTPGPQGGRLRRRLDRGVPYIDHLEDTLAPLNPRVFEVRSPEDFRKAIASILIEAGRS